MADGVVLDTPVTPGVTAATDDCGAPGHAQIVKLAVSADGSATVIPADTTNGLDVDVTRLIPGTTATALGKAEDVAVAGGDVGVAALTMRQDTPASTTDTDGDYQHLKTDSVGRLHVNGSGVTQPVSGTVSANLNAGTNNIGDVDVLTLPALPAGNNNIGDVDVVTLPSLPAGNNNIGDVDVASVVPGTGATNLGKAEDVAAAGGDTGVALLTVRQDTAATDTTNDGDYQFAKSTNKGEIYVKQTDPVPVTDNGGSLTVDGSITAVLSVAASGGVTPYRNIDVDETEDAIKASAGRLFWVHCMNLAATKVFLHFYDDTVANVIVGTTTPTLTFPVPTMGDTNGAGFNLSFGDLGIGFANAITVAATTGFSGAGAPSDNTVFLNAGFV